MFDEREARDDHTQPEQDDERHDERPVPVQAEDRRLEELKQRRQTEEDQYDG